MSDREPDYSPLACSLHDLIEDAATRRLPVRLRIRTSDGAEEEVTDRIADWFVRDHAEYLRTTSGREIRLDAIFAMNGTPFR